MEDYIGRLYTHTHTLSYTQIQCTVHLTVKQKLQKGTQGAL